MDGLDGAGGADEAVDAIASMLGEPDETPEPDETSSAPPEDADAEPSTEGSAASDDTEAKPAEASEAVGVNTLTDLATALEVDPAEFLRHIKVDGPDGNQVPLAEVLDAYAKAPEAVRKHGELETQRAELEQQRATLRWEQDAKLNELAQTTQLLLNQIAKEPQVDWDDLRESDPSEYAAKWAEQQQRREAVQASIAKLEQEAAARDAEQARLRQEFRQAEAAKLRAAMPDVFGDPQSAQQNANGLAEYLARSGFTAEEIAGTEDHRHFVLAWKAKQYDELKGKTTLAREKVAGARKIILPSGARRDETGGASRKSQEAMTRLRNEGSVEAAAALIEGRI